MLRTENSGNWKRQPSISSLLAVAKGTRQRSLLFYILQRTHLLSLLGQSFLGRGGSADNCISDGVSFLPAPGKNSPSSPAVRDLLDRHQASLGRSQSFSHQQPSRSHIMRYGVLAGCASLPQWTWLLFY